MDASEVVVSEWAREQCERWAVAPDELVQARVEGSVLFEESVIEKGRVVIWGPRRADGTHLHIVCGPEAHIINDFRPLTKRPVYLKAPFPIRPV